jgi:hypothetical protein
MSLAGLTLDKQLEALLEAELVDAALRLLVGQGRSHAEQSLFVQPLDGGIIQLELSLSEDTPGASWRNEAIDDIARDGRGEWKKRSGYHQRSLVENTCTDIRHSRGIVSQHAALVRKRQRSQSVLAS